MEQRIKGTATAVDGDTLDLGGVRVRLLGIDAPESRQECQKEGKSWKCGEDASAMLAELVQDSQIECLSRETDVYGRLVATCSRDGLDLGLAMIEAGLAITLDNSPQKYAAVEALRKTYKVGIWSSDFQPPKDWRAQNSRDLPKTAPRPSQAASRQQSRPAEQVYRNQLGCAIKGNRNKRGEWIYHMPGRPYYDQTRPEELFCTEAEARRAGYRRSKS
jgi:endonuclease YncB( thermonuclease family)